MKRKALMDNDVMSLATGNARSSKGHCIGMRRRGYGRQRSASALLDNALESGGYDWTGCDVIGDAAV